MWATEDFAEARERSTQALMMMTVFFQLYSFLSRNQVLGFWGELWAVDVPFCAGSGEPREKFFA
jgi:hypothetical protein